MRPPIEIRGDEGHCYLRSPFYALMPFDCSRLSCFPGVKRIRSELVLSTAQDFRSADTLDRENIRAEIL